VSVGGGGTIDPRGDTFEGCGNDLSKSPCDGYARPQNIFFSNATGVVFEDVTVLNSPDWSLHFSSVDGLRVR
jgi:polygalacturonase